MKKIYIIFLTFTARISDSESGQSILLSLSLPPGHSAAKRRPFPGAKPGSTVVYSKIVTEVM